MATDFHPPRLMISFVLAPVAANMVTACRKSWKRTQVSPARRRAVSQMTQNPRGRNRSPVAPVKRGASLSGPTKRRRWSSSAGRTELGR